MKAIAFLSVLLVVSICGNVYQSSRIAQLVESGEHSEKCDAGMLISAKRYAKLLSDRLRMHEGDEMHANLMRDNAEVFNAANAIFLNGGSK